MSGSTAIPCKFTRQSLFPSRSSFCFANKVLVISTFRWLSSQSPEPVVGISVAHTVWAPGKGNPSAFLIDEIWGEFDSAAWLVNLGILKPAKKAKRAEAAVELSA